MNRTEKTNLAESLKEKFSKAQLAVFLDYKGLKATEADEFRKRCRASQAEVKVLKNNIARVVSKDGALGDGAKQVMDGLVGPTMVAFSYGDPAAVAKAIKKFTEENEALVLKDSLLGKTRITAKEVQALADLPSREQLLSMLLSVMNGPARNFVSVLAAVPRGLVTVLAAIKDKKEKQA
jgi:large subunit ribosomal protein L10